MSSHTKDEFYSNEALYRQQTNGNVSILGPMEDLKPTTTNLTMTPEMFEKLYLSPKNRVAGDLRKTFGNPTPVGVIGLALALTPLSAEMMGWRGAAGFSSTIGANYFSGGMLLTITGLLEFLLGNTFPSVVFFTIGSYLLAFAATFDPRYAAISAYTTDGSQTMTPPFMVGFGFYHLAMALACTIFLICTLRTNAVLFFIFLSADLGFCFATASFWMLADGHLVTGNRLSRGGGGCIFAASLCAWYNVAAMLFESVDFPISLPVGDLSHLIKGASQKAKEKKEREE